MKGIQVSKGHSHPGDHRQTNKSGHGRNPSEQGALMSWRVQMDRQVRRWKESKLARGTHKPKSADGQTSQDMEGIQVSKGHSQTGEHRWTDKSGHRRNPSEQGALTSWRTQMDRQVRTQKESK